MTEQDHMQRRRLLRIGAAALAAIPVMIVAGRADAATNVKLRTGLKYQDTPQGERSCANCKQFVPGASTESLGGCVILSGDTEISPHGFCIGWAKKA